MEEKKSPKANLENKKLMFIQIGLIISLAVAWAVFEMKSYDKREIDESLLRSTELLDEEMVEITKQEEPKPEPVEMPKTTTQLEIVEDDVEVEDIEINAEMDQNEVVEEYVAPEIEEEEVVEQEIFQIVEEMPSFPASFSSRRWRRSPERPSSPERSSETRRRLRLRRSTTSGSVSHSARETSW